MDGETRRGVSGRGEQFLRLNDVSEGPSYGNASLGYKNCLR